MIIDAHQHFWNLDEEPQPWMTDEHAAIRRTFGPADLEPLLAAAGVTHTILVQAACTDRDTDAMLAHAAATPWIAGVVAWVDLRSPAGPQARLDELARDDVVCGIRHLIHDEPDPHWILQPPVLESLALLEERDLALDLPCVYPRHLGDVPVLARTFPALHLVDRPPRQAAAGHREMDDWAPLLRAAAAHDECLRQGLGARPRRADPRPAIRSHSMLRAGTAPVRQ